MTQRIDIANESGETVLLYDVEKEDLLKTVSELDSEGFHDIGAGEITSNSKLVKGTVFYCQLISKDTKFQRLISDEEIIDLIGADLRTE